MRMTTIIHNYIHGHQCQDMRRTMRRSLRAVDGTGPELQIARASAGSIGTLMSRPAASNLCSARAVDL